MSHFDNQTPYVPTYPPALGSQKLMELEADNSYLKYLYPKITRQISEFVEEECDKMEYEGSLMFDVFPDKIALQLMAAGIAGEFTKIPRFLSGGRKTSPRYDRGRFIS